MSENQNESFLAVKDLEVQYSADDQIIHAVNSVSFELKRGKTIGLVGETGAGKTTVAKSILRILPDISAKITGGAVNFCGQDLLTLPEAEMRKVRGKKISMVFQDPMTALNPSMRVGKQIAEVIELHNDVTKQEAQERAKAMLELVGIPGARYPEYPHQFPGGMQQRVVIAMALACDPELLIADEPTTALDVTIQAQVLEMINELKVNNNTSMIMITHDLGIVAEVCDDVAVVYAGEIIESGPKEEIFDHPSHPYTIGLFGAFPQMTVDVKRLSPVPGLPPDPANLPQGCSFHPRCPYADEACKADRIEDREIRPGHHCRCIHTDKVKRPPILSGGAEGKEEV